MTDLPEAVRRQERLLDVLACPGCGDPLQIAAAARHLGLVVAADLMCPAHGRVGVVESYDVSFRPADLSRTATSRTPGGYVRVPVPVDDPLVTEVGDWLHGWEGARTHGEGIHELGLPFEGVGVSVSFYAHDWCGQAELVVDGEPVRVVDLHRSETELVPIDVTGLPEGHHELRIRATGVGNPRNGGDQVVVSRIDVLVRPENAPLPSIDPVNRGNGFPPRFERLLSELGPDAVVVDVGGGDRRLGDPRVFNLEYMNFELPDIYADGLRLPFRTGSLDLVLSQAVLEHVPDPHKAIDELRRVLKPDGILYIEIAFMQPLHAVPSHYFNVTSYGLEHLLRDWEVLEQGVFTGLHDTFEWFARCVDAERKVGKEKLDRALEVLAEIDSKTSEDELRPVAGSVWATARRGSASLRDADRTEVAATLDAFTTEALLREVDVRLRKAARSPVRNGRRVLARVARWLRARFG